MDNSTEFTIHCFPLSYSIINVANWHCNCKTKILKQFFYYFELKSILKNTVYRTLHSLIQIGCSNAYRLVLCINLKGLSSYQSTINWQKRKNPFPNDVSSYLTLYLTTFEEVLSAVYFFCFVNF